MSRNSLFLNIVFIAFLAFSIMAWTWPTESKFITSDFGPRDYGSGWDWHEAIDIRGEKKNIYAAEDGEAWGLEGSKYNTIKVEHDLKTSMYLHCSSVDVLMGEKNKKKVKAGDKIGLTGNAGCKDYHLDFRFEDESHPLKYLPYENSADPTVEEFIKPKDGEKVKGTIDVKVYVTTTTDKDLNKCQLYIDDELLKDNGTISYDPKTNCSSTTAFPKKVNSVGEDFFVFKWNTNDVENGKHTLKVIATDAKGQMDPESIEVEVENDAPVVKEKCVEKEGGGSLQQFVLSNSLNLSAFRAGSACFFNSYADDIPIDVSKISFSFSKPMDQGVTDVAISVYPSFGYTVSWADENTLNLELTEMLDYCKEYTITVSDTLEDTSGVHLDGNEDGEPRGDYIFNFTVENPPLDLSLAPATDLFELKNPGDCQSKKGNITIDGSKLLKEVLCKLSKSVSGSGLNFSGGEGSFTIPAGESQNTGFTVTACNEGGISVNLTATSSSNVCATTAGGYSASLEKEKDHPDDNQSPGASNYATTITLADDTLGNPDKVGIFIYGWTIGYAHLLGKYGIPIETVFSDFTYWKNPDTLLSDEVPLVVIGSGALSGFNSQEFKQNLEDYVVNGGNLLVLTQKYGSDLSVLPGNIEGYGWNEDQSCFKNAAYLSRWHPVLSGQTKQVMDCNVDGYISEYPTNAEILLGRTKNAMPSLLYYNYGAGTVIISSLYSDWGYGHNQTSSEELRLIRDLTTWALNPEMEIPEFYRDSSVSVPVFIKYTANDTIPATSAIIKIYTPDRDLYDSLSLPISLNPGGETEWVWNASSLPENLGLWIIDYALMDGFNEWIQGYNRGAIFAQKVDVPTGDYNLGDFQMWANSDKEEIMKGNTVNFEVFVKNNTGSLFTGKLMIGVHEERDEGGVSWKVIDSIPDITIPSDSMVMVVSPVTLNLSTSTYFGLYEKSHSYYSKYFRNALVRCQKGVWVIPNPFPISLSKDKYRYILGVDTIHYTVESSNELSDSCSTFIDVYTVLDSVRYNIWSDTVELAGKEKKEFNKVFFPANYDTTIGREKLCCDLFYRDSLWSYVSTNFDLTYPNVQCSLAIPDSFNYGNSNLYTVALTSEANYIPAGKLLLSGVNYSDSLIIDYTPRAETTLVFDYQPDVWEVSGRVSSNKLKVQYQYGDETIKRKYELPFRLPLISSFRPEYPKPQGGFMPGDTATFKAQLALTGNLYGVPLEFCLWSDYLGVDTLRDTIILNPCSHRTINLKTYTDMSIPADTSISYNYRMNYLNKEYTTTEELQYSVLSPEAVLHWPVNDTFSIGATIPIEFTNEIKTPSRVDIEAVYLRGDYNAGDVIESFDGPGEVEIPGEGSYNNGVRSCFLNFQI